MMKKADKNRYVKFLIYLIVVILLNVAGITLFFRSDLTSGKVYSLSEVSERVVSTLSEPLTVKVFFNSNLPAPYNNIERYLHDLLEEYAIAGKSRFNYLFYNVSEEEDEGSARNRQLAESYGIYPVQIQNIEQDEVKFQKAYMGMVLIHGDMIETLPALTSTEGLEYQITSKIRRMNNKISALLNLRDSVSVRLFLSSSLAAVGPYMNITGLPELPGRIEEIVTKLNEKNYGKLSFFHHDPSMRPEDEEQADKYRILRLNWDKFSDRRGRTVPADRGYAGIVVEHGSNVERIQVIEVIRLPIFGAQYQLAELSSLEEKMNSAIENVIDINEEIGYLAGHGSPDISALPQIFGGSQQYDSLSSLKKLLSEEYSIKQIDLKESSIPSGLKTLIIAGPTESFTEYDLYQIDQFLMQGKNLALFIDPFMEMSPPGEQGMMARYQPPYYAPVRTGLEKLLNHYGMNIETAVVLDEQSYKDRVSPALGGGERQIYYAPIIKSEMINSDLAYLSNIKGLVMLKAAPVSVDESRIKEENLKATRLFSSSERSWEMKDRFEPNPMYMQPPDDEDDFTSIPLAYVVEGRFSSYFTNRAIPAKEENQTGGDENQEMKSAAEDTSGTDMSKIRTEGETIKKGKPGKIFLIGTSEILRDNVIDDEGKTPNAQFVMNVLDFLNSRVDTAIMRSKTQTFNPLHETKPVVRTAVKTANVAGLPVLVMISGLMVWLRRSSRKRKIQQIFSGER